MYKYRRLDTCQCYFYIYIKEFKRYAIMYLVMLNKIHVVNNYFVLVPWSATKIHFGKEIHVQGCRSDFLNQLSIFNLFEF